MTLPPEAPPDQHFRPGLPLPTDPQQAKERTLYHVQRRGGQWATMTREGGIWQWRQLHGAMEKDGYGTGPLSEMQQWLNQGA